MATPSTADSLIDQGMEKQGAKKRRREEEDGSTDMNRISQLPQPILHHILSFLSQKEAVQTSVLSKTWRYLWNARPNLEFREEWFMRNNENFLSVLGNTLQRYFDQNLSIQDYILELMKMDVNPELFSVLGKWIPIVMLNLGLKTFKLCFNSCSNFDMPSVVFQAKSLQELELQRCKLNFDNNSTDNLFLLSNLRKLDLRYVHISEKLEHILSSCPLINFLDLNQCELLRTINLKKARNLKHFGFQAYYRYASSTVIHVPNTLESIRTSGSPNWFFHLENIYFSHLKSLHLVGVKLSAELFNKFSSTYCPCLENLTLDGCQLDFKGFQLSSRSITRLEILMPEKIEGFKFSIDAPNILYFKFSSSNFVPSISLATTSVKWESHVSVTEYKIDNALWFHDLNKLLKALSHSRIHLELRLLEYKHIEEDSDGGDSNYDYEPVQIEELRFAGLFSYPFFKNFLNCLLIRTCRPNYIDMALLFKIILCSPWGGITLVESVCTILLGELEIGSWQKDLEKCSMEVWNKKAGEWCLVKGARLTEDEWLKRPRPGIRFRLTWRELS